MAAHSTYHCQGNLALFIPTFLIFPLLLLCPFQRLEFVLELRVVVNSVPFLSNSLTARSCAPCHKHGK